MTYQTKKSMHDLGTGKALLTEDLIVGLLVRLVDTGFSKLAIYYGVWLVPFSPDVNLGEKRFSRQNAS